MRNVFAALLILCMLCAGGATAQEAFLVHLESAVMPGQPRTDLLNYSVIYQGSTPVRARLKGALRFYNSADYIRYEKEVRFSSGVNLIRELAPAITLQFSGAALRELYNIHGKLPLGKMEYCVTIETYKSNGEQAGWQPVKEECVYISNEDIFMIELQQPEDGAELKEFHPQLGWIVNSPLAPELTYRLMVAPKNKNQSKQDAIRRNRLQYDEKNISGMFQVYPMYAKPLEYNQPYVWNVEAYYKGYLMGTAMPWEFIILPDTARDSVAYASAYLDIMKDVGTYNVIAPGVLKLSYELKQSAEDSLTFALLDKDQKPLKIKVPVDGKVRYGDNRLLIDFYNYQPLKHKKKYTLLVSGRHFKDRRIEFTYYNPDL